MPIEIREIVIQAQVQDPSAASPVVQRALNGAGPVEAGRPENAEQAPADPEWIEKVVEQCVARLQEWLTEKSIR
ncbi:MAG: DUF5908 family protein [Thermoanaerobaculia bacterium]|nr:DUF5908 family protein [Thermoanaerobaculia bacterium]